MTWYLVAPHRKTPASLRSRLVLRCEDCTGAHDPLTRPVDQGMARLLVDADMCCESCGERFGVEPLTFEKTKEEER